MKRLRLTMVSAALLATGVLFTGNGSGRFDTKLSKDQQILHALNRLTFGARPGDIEEVRRLGVDKWIDLQLHPDRISENAVLEARLKPLETLRLDPSEILKEYALVRPGLAPQPVRPTDLVPQDQYQPPGNYANSGRSGPVVSDGVQRICTADCVLGRRLRLHDRNHATQYAPFAVA